MPSGNLGDLDTNYLTFPRNVRFNVTCDGVDEFTKAARLSARDGVDTIKVNVSGDRDWGRMHADDTVTVRNASLPRLWKWRTPVA